MELDLSRYKQILLNDRSVWYKPNIDLLKRLSTLFKGINIFGFGRYPETGCWYLLATSPGFPENYLGVPIVIPLSEVFTWAIPRLVPLPK